MRRIVLQKGWQFYLNGSPHTGGSKGRINAFRYKSGDFGQDADLTRAKSRCPRRGQLLDSLHHLPLSTGNEKSFSSTRKLFNCIMADIVEVSSPPSSPEFESLGRTSKELCEELDECLSNIQSDGSFALFEHLSNPPNPGIYLKNGGLIGLPLSNRDAQVIVAASHAAPFGKGEETLVDENVRKTWELSASDFELRNLAWQAFLESIVAKVSAGLGVDATGKGVSAELYKMLLYDKGAMFKPHQERVFPTPTLHAQTNISRVQRKLRGCLLHLSLPSPPNMKVEKLG
jgi:hypothetical protein